MLNRRKFEIQNIGSWRTKNKNKGRCFNCLVWTSENISLSFYYFI